MPAYFKGEGLVEHRVECLFVNFCVKLLLFVGKDEDLNIGVRGAAAVHREEVSCLQDPYRQLQRSQCRSAAEL